jgi:tetratricopeptide (TPR) repeat protein
MLRGKSEHIFADRNVRFWGLVVFVVALILRVIFLLEFESVPLFQTPVMDMLYYHQLALGELRSPEIVNGPYFKAPLYPLFLNLVYDLFGEGPWPIRLVQAFIGSLSALLTFLIGLRLFSLRTGVVAGLIVAACGTLILYDGQLLVPNLVIFLNLFSVYCLIRGLELAKAHLFLLSGLALGLSAIARPTVLLFAGVVVVLLWWELRRSSRQVSRKSLILFAAGVILAILPVTVRNYVKSGEFVVIGTYGGINLYIGNNLQSDGVSTTIPGTGLDWWGEGMMEDAKRLAENDVGHKLSPSEQSAYWRNRAINEMAANPGFFMKHLLRKLLLFIGGYELANNFDVYYVAHQASLMKLLLTRRVVYIPWGVLLPLAVVGIILIPNWTIGRRIVLAFLLAYLPMLLLFFVTARYRLPMLPFLVLFASYALVSGYTALKRCSKPRKLLAAGAFVLFFALSQSDIYGFAGGTDAQGHQLMAAIYNRQGNLTMAERYYRKALEADSTLPHANNDLGVLLMSRGENEEATRLLLRAVRFAPDDYLLRYNLGIAFLNGARWEQAITLFQAVLRQAPDYSGAASNLGLAWLQLGQTDSALVAYQRAIAANPNDPDAYFAVGYTYHLLGEVDSARAYYRWALDQDPWYAKALYNLGRLWLQQGVVDSSVASFDQFLSLSSGLIELEADARRILDSLSTR